MQFKNKARTKISFQRSDFGKVEKEILNLDKTKASQKMDISTRIIDIFADFLCTSINSAIKSSSFPSSLKLVGIIPMHKKRERI